MELNGSGEAKKGEAGLLRVDRLPAQERAAPSHARTDRHHSNEITLLQLPCSIGLIERDWQGGAGGVAVAIDVEPAFFARNGEPIDDRFDDAGIGLMGNDVVYRTRFQSVRRERFKERIGKNPEREFVDLPTVHRDFVHVFGENFLGLRMSAAAARDRQYSRGISIGMKMGGNQPA